MGSRWRMVGAGKWQSLGDGRRWRNGSGQNGSRWRMGGAGEWQSPENGSRWRMVVAGKRVAPGRLGSNSRVYRCQTTSDSRNYDSQTPSFPSQLFTTYIRWMFVKDSS